MINELNIKRKIDKETGKVEKKTGVLLNLYVSTNEELESIASKYGAKKSDIIRHAINNLVDQEQEQQNKQEVTK